MRDAAEARAQGRVAKAAVRRLAARLESLMAFVEATA